MMISTKGRYALRIMIDLAEHQSEGYVPLKETANRQEISEKYLEGIGKEQTSGGFKRQRRWLPSDQITGSVHSGKHFEGD